MRKQLFVLVAINFYVTCFAQTNRQPELYFNRLSIENGLPQAQVFDFLQDKYGYMWIGTQSGLVRYDGYNCKTYSFGLKQSWLTVKKIFEDKTGLLWAGTKANGLYRYNRATDSFTQYSLALNNNKDSFELRILNMQDDAFGNLWIHAETNFSNQQIICRFNIETGKCIYYGSSQKDNYKINATEFHDLYAGDNGKFFIASNNGIYEYDGKQESLVPHFATEDPAKQTGFKDLCADPVKPNVLWMSALNIKSNTAAGVYRFDEGNNSFTIYKHDPQDTSTILNNTVLAIKKDSKNQLWFASADGLSVFNPGKNQFSNFLPDTKQNKPAAVISSICEDKNDNFWCISGNDQLVYFNTKTKTFTNCKIKHTGVTGADNFRKLNIDKNGTLWATNSDGLEWLNSNRSKFILYTQRPDQPHNFNGNKVWSFAAAKDGSIYLSSEHGVYHWQPQTDSFSLVDFAKTKNYDLGPCFITIDKKGCLWIGIQKGQRSIKGLYCYDPKTHKTQNYVYKENDSTSLSFDQVSYVFADRQDNIWVGTWGTGICKLNRQSKTFTRYGYGYTQSSNKEEAGNELDGGAIACIYQDKKGTIWAGSFDGGLNRYNSGANAFAPFKIQGLRGVVHLSEDNEGNLWGGTYLDGAFKLNLNTNKLVQFSQEQGLLYNGVVSIMEDDHHGMWFITQRGISILNPYNNSFRSITKEYGLPENQNYSQFTSILKIPTGELVFGTNSGFIKLDPGDFSIDTITPEINIETVSFTKNTKNNASQDSFIIIADKKDIHLSHNENRITFAYVGLEYQNTGLVQYAYKLDGYDNDWINAGTQRTVTYINLPPGTYTFHVKAANGDGVWSKQDESVNIVIAYPWWNTWWAYILYIAALALIIWLFAVYRSKKLKQQNKLLEQKVEHRTEQLNQSLEELKATQGQLIQSEKMASLGELTAGIAHEIQNPLNFVNNFSEVNKELIEELKGEKSKVKSERDDELEDQLLNDIEQNLEKINHHGKRADSIVKGMLQHSRTTSGQKEPTDINALCDEYLRLAYHGLRAKDKNFNAEIKTDFDSSIGKLNIVPQEIGRVILNLINNAFYAVNEKKKQHLNGYEPTVSVSTTKENGKVEVSVRDNGNGISQKVLGKIFQPFFTTKPTGEGTGLGLSLSYDIIKAHGGEIKVETKEGEGSEFIIML